MNKKQIISSLFLVTMMLMACSNEPKSNNEVITNDTIQTKDSVAQPEINRVDENKALGNIEFGITNKQFEADLIKFQNTLEHNEFKTLFVIGEYICTDIQGSFENNKLYKLTTTGDFISYQRYKEELVPQVEILKEMIAKKYGEPHSGSGAPVINQSKKGFSYLAYSWTIGSKAIEIRVTNRDLYYSADLKIYQPEIENLIHKRESDKSTRTVEPAKDAL